MVYQSLNNNVVTIEEDKTVCDYPNVEEIELLYNEIIRNQNEIFNDMPGLCGIRNLGNTCYLNAAVQCLAHTQDIIIYFSNDQFHVVENNNTQAIPVAKDFGDIVTKMWSGDAKEIIPRSLKFSLSKYRNILNDFHQHDAIDALSAILEAIHESTNIGVPSEYSPEDYEDEDFEPQKIRALTNDMQTEDSFISHNFSGHFFSQIQCMSCNNVVNRFHSYHYVSLPVQIIKTHTLSFLFIPYDLNEKPINIMVQCPVTTQLYEYPMMICEKISRNVDLIFATKVGNKYKISLPSSNLDVINFAFEIPDKSKLYIPIIIMVQITNEGAIQQVEMTTPVLVEIGESIPDDLNPIFEERMRSFWKEEGNLPNPEFESIIRGGAFIFEENQKFKIRPILEPLTQSELYANVASVFLTICLNEKLTTYDNGFDWSMLNQVQPLPQMPPEEYFTIRDCLYFFSREVICEDSGWICARCKEKVIAKQFNRILTAPKYLIIQFNRFNNFKRQKDGSFVYFPFELDISEYVVSDNEKKSTKYKLYSVVNHNGNLEGGHYIALCEVYDRWFCFNDTSCKEIDASEVITNKALILFYERIDQDEN